MKINTPLVSRRMLAIVFGLLVVYCISFFSFFHSHDIDGIRGPIGQGVTMGFLAVPDTKMNRFLIAIYAPMFKCFSPGYIIEWEKR